MTESPATNDCAAQPASDWRSRLGIAILVMTAIGLTSIDVRPFADVGERYIGHADTANAAIVARNITEKAAPVTDVVWLLHGGGPDGPDVTHREGYWSIYVAALIAIAMTFVGPNVMAVHLVASLLKTAVAGVTFWWVYRLTKDVTLGSTAGLIALFSPGLAAGINGSSDIYLTLSVAISTSFIVTAIHQPKLWRWVAAGATIGVSVGFKPSGILLLGLLPFVWFLGGRRGYVARGIGVLLFTMVLSLSPLFLHNYRAAGTLLWPDLPRMQLALLHLDAYRPFRTFRWDKPEQQVWNASAYNPQSRDVTVPRFSRRWIRAHANNLTGFAWSVVNGNIIPLWVLPFAFLAVVRVAKLQFRGSGSRNEYESFVASTAILSLGACMLGTTVHTENRYFMFLLPLYLIIALVEAARLSRWLVGFGLLITIPLGLEHYSRVNYPSAARTDHVAEYQRLDRMLPNDAVAITQNPWEVSFHTRRRAVVLPYNEDFNVTRDLARRFNADYLAVVHEDVRHPGLIWLHAGVSRPGLRLVHQSEGLIIYRFVELPGDDAFTDSPIG